MKLPRAGIDLGLRRSIQATLAVWQISERDNHLTANDPVRIKTGDEPGVLFPVHGDKVARCIANLMRPSAWRRIIGIACALAVLTVSFAHSMQHFHGPASSTTSQISMAASGDDPDNAAGEPAIDAVHCHACGMMAIAVLAPEVAPLYVVMNAEPVSAPVIRSHLPLAETPPPIARAD